MAKIGRALISVSDKTGVVELAKGLAAQGVEILSTGGTARAIKEAGVQVVDVSEFTGFPEMMAGRLKTLHPKIHGGLLGRRDSESDLKDMEAHGIKPIDMVVVNLYPFEATISKEGVKLEEAIENIDIGGPTMLRSAAKNHRDVAVVVDPADYQPLLGEMKQGGGEVGHGTLYRLARKVFEHTASYDALIAEYLRDEEEGEKEAFPQTLTMTSRLASTLRYGENPHQRAAFYFERSQGYLSLHEAKQHQGKEMSFNNYYDTHSALVLALEFDSPACSIIKHNNPCGVAVGSGAAEAYLKAQKTDPISAFGGVLAFNCPVDEEAAREMAKLFIEVVIAPSFTAGALKVFGEKKNVRLLELPGMDKPLKGFDIKRIAGGFLLQDWDAKRVDVRSLKAATKREPTPEELEGLEFGWRVAKHVKSNAIVYAYKDATAGIGVGQTSRVFAARTGAQNAVLPLKGTVVASDGFFPFRDGVDELHEQGVTAVIQPGGSLKDDEVIKACDEHGMAMLLTGARHFKH
ncbi:MAG: bifunctional phosphoribosylaminoimidazolecarboxamide formyltransferase/IMP cyclohydrolase [Nitrospirota bacterium]|jgi:phosphoribosylaminoimidazolecarboxamide formyltransferase/IMP cyclohydrolase